VYFTGFYEIVKLHWDSNPFFSNMARTISGKFKQLRKLQENCEKVLAESIGS
jgi:hypothetical protein